VAEVRAALDAFHPAGDVLELAAGTGLWTQRLAQTAAHVTAVDASPEVLALNRQRVGDFASRVTFSQVDLFAWQPDRLYDTVFFGFWLSHVPQERFAGFWSLVRAALKPGGRVFFVDSLYADTSTATNHELEGPDATSVTRRLNDGQRFRIVKVFYRPGDLRRRLADLGWSMHVQTTETYFIFGSGMPG
jgi:demethylmenaquinone methyltransferase/2-methoxy-6-polyprenyl-1,4-benzoquinol methylase